MIPVRRVAPLVLLASAACAGGGAATRPSPAVQAPSEQPAAAPQAAPVRAAPAAPAEAAKRTLAPRTQRLFDDAVAAAAAQKRLKVPTDWETLERRWRAVLDEEQVPEAWYNLGVVLERRHQPDEARAAYRRALALAPDLAPAATNLALLEEPADPTAAAQTWSALASRFPDDPLPRQRLAALYEAAGQHDEAWRLGREALQRNPRSAAAYKVLMRVALARGRTDLAMLLAVKARKLDEHDPEVVSFVGDVLARQKDEAGALAQWRKAVALRDDFLPARYALLDDALRKQLWEGVAEQAKAILRSRQDDARVHLALGIAYRYTGQVDKALAQYDQAERVAGDRMPETHLARGVALMRGKEQCDPAIAELKRYMALAGPASAEGPAYKLVQECTQLLVASKQAEDAAREVQAEAAREAARKEAAAQPAAEPTR